MDNEETLQRIAVAEQYNKPGSRDVLKEALERVSEATAFLAFLPGVERLTPDECHALSRALDLFIPTLTPIVKRLNS